MALLDVFLGALVVFAATSAGALLILTFRRIGPLGYSILLSFSAGVMAYSAIEMLGASNSSSGAITAIFGLLLGVGSIFLMDRLLPHVHARIRGCEIEASKKKAVMLAGAITIHNVPEGFAVASAFASSNPLGWLVTASIALQDIPEGFMISAPLACYGVERKRALFFGCFSGFVEAVAALAGYFLLSLLSVLTPFGLAFSAGAMAYVILADILPDSFARGNRRAAGVSFIAGAACAFAIASAFSL